jgi:hypothetical protein
MISVWVLVMWTVCDTCDPTPWVHSTYRTEAACAVAANRAQPQLDLGHLRSRCYRSNLF